MSNEELLGKEQERPFPSSTVQTHFDWAIYADATFAGLSPLIPIPVVDWIFEALFRARMPGSIAKRNGRPLKRATINEINRLPQTCLQTCLGLPILLTFGILKEVSEKIFYFMTIKEAGDKLSFYWQRAFLLNHMLALGHLDSMDTTITAVHALNQVLATTAVSPLNQLAQQTVRNSRHIFRTLRRARQSPETADANETRSRMAQAWDNFADYFNELAQKYDQRFAQLEELRQSRRQSPSPPPV